MTYEEAFATAERIMSEMDVLLAHTDRHIAQLVAVRDLMLRHREHMRNSFPTALTSKDKKLAGKR